MKILELKVSNIKNIKAVDISPKDNTIILEGKNGAGKSAILDAIFTTLTGKRIDEPIRSGEERAEVVVSLGDLIVKKVWTKSGERLEVSNSDGAKYSNPQTKLNELIGELSFDPLAFKSMKTMDRMVFLKNLLNLDFSSLNKEFGDCYSMRTEVNRRIRDLEGKIANAKFDKTLPDKEYSIVDELGKVELLRKKRMDFLNCKSKIEHIESEIVKNEDYIKELEKKISSIRDINKNLLTEKKAIVITEEVLEEKVRIAEDSIKTIEQKNILIRDNNKIAAVGLEIDSEKKKVEQLTTRMSDIQKEKEKKIRDTKFPIDGLSFGEDNVLFGGIPFDRLSTGEQIRISTLIAMALNPTLKLILIRDGSLLDDRGTEEIKSLAVANNYQLWIEKVSEVDHGGIYIESGEIK